MPWPPKSSPKASDPLPPMASSCGSLSKVAWVLEAIVLRGGRQCGWSGRMVHVVRIDSLDLPEVAPYRTMRRQLEHRRKAFLSPKVTKSSSVCSKATSKSFRFLLPEQWLAHFEPLLAKRSEMIRVYLLKKQQLESLTGFTFYQGVLAVGRIRRLRPLETFFTAVRSPVSWWPWKGLRTQKIWVA